MFCRVRVCSVEYEICYKAFLYGYEKLTELAELLGTGMEVLRKSQNLSGRVRYCTELTKLVGYE